jgi:formylglycine-generating enzyme required for sulfatase activity
MRRLAVILGLALAGGCGGGAGGATSTGNVGEDAAATRSPWRIIDLESGSTETRLEVADLQTNPAYRDRLVVFRLIRAADHGVGQAPGTFARQSDEEARRVDPPPVAIAAFELTRAQWQRLAGTTPWLALAPAEVGFPAGAADLPATGMSAGEAEAALAAWSTTHGVRLHLPEPDAWEAAARGGIQTAFPWGPTPASGTPADWCVVWDGGASPGPQAVGMRRANPLGLYDVVGNVAELVADGSARGGSWADPVALARLANRLELMPDTRHAGVGLRLAYRP